MQTNTLDRIDPIQLGADLKRARERRGLTQKDAADIISVARTTITAIESGQRKIKASELVLLSRAYGFELGDFVREERPRSVSFEPQFRSVYHRKQDEPIADTSITELEELARNYVELERLTNSPLHYRYPEEYRVTGSRLDQIAESVAVQERQRLGLGDTPIPIMRSILEQEVGLRIFYLHLLPSTYSAMYVFDPAFGGCIAVNRDHPVERRRWSLAHEYAHFLVHRHRPDLVDDSYERLPERERFADAFARYFLMPTSSLMKRIGARDVSRADLFILANYYGVSVEALTRRLEDMRIIPIGTWDEMRQRGVRVRDIQKQLGLEAVPDHTGAVPVRYQYLAVMAYEEGLISEGGLAHFLRVGRLEVRKIVEHLKTSDANWEFSESTDTGEGF